MAKGDLDRLIERQTKKDPAFPLLMQAAERRQKFGAALAEKRERLGISQRAMALKMKTSATVIARLEQGGDVQLTTLERYLGVLGMGLKLGMDRPATTSST